MITRRIAKPLLGDLKKKMVFLAGPRQCGKTTLAQSIPGLIDMKSAYFSWDIPEQRKAILHRQLHTNSKLWIFDEIHKYSKWRNWLKGVYDEFHKDHKLLVTGSAKLDVFSRGGDSLQGRYFLHHLHPITFSELLGLRFDGVKTLPTFENTPPSGSKKALQDLLLLGGFPEPLTSGSEKEAQRWRLFYGHRVVDEEIRSLERVLDVDRLELLLDRLPVTVGSVLSINSLREDLEVAFETARNWLEIFERMYLTYRIPPFGAPKLKAVKKEQKLYFWDWSRVQEDGPRFENLIASHLMRLVDWFWDVEGEKAELRYFRDVNGHETDFILLRNQKPWLAVECKTSQENLDSNLKYLLQRVDVPHAIQVSLKGEKDWVDKSVGKHGVRILPATQFLSSLP